MRYRQNCSYFCILFAFNNKTIKQVDYNRMKQVGKYICACTLCCCTLLMITSCLGDGDTIDPTPECAIVSFSVGDIKSAIVEKNHAGNDSTYYRTISGSSIKFNIDQIGGLISSVDSLPDWINLTRVVPSFTAHGSVYYKLNEQYYYLTSGVDSIDMSNGAELLVVGNDEKSSKRYQVKINKNEGEVDTLIWDELHTSINLVSPYRLMSKDNQLYVFSISNNGSTTVSTSTDGSTWTSPVESDMNPDFESLLIFKGKFYALDSQKHLIASRNAVDWEIAAKDATNGMLQADRMLAADEQYIYILSDGNILSSSDLTPGSWTINGTTDINMLPQNNIRSIFYPTKTNTAMSNVIMAGTNPSYTDGAVVWYKVSSAEKTNDQQWNYIQITADNPYPLPYADNIDLLRINGLTLAYIADQAQGTQGFYQSEDNGITWHKNMSAIIPPTQMEAHQPSSAAVMGGKFWILQGGTPAKIWAGTLK